MIRPTKTSITLITIFFAVAICWATQAIETEIGPFNLSLRSLTEAKVISQFGQGCVRVKKDGNEILTKEHIYYVPNEGIWVAIRFSHVLDDKLERNMEEILVTKRKLCDNAFKPIKSFGPLVTSRGIRIGDSIDKVIKTYGTPSVNIEIGKDKIFSALGEDLKFKKGRVLRYLTNRPDELIFAEFYFDEKGLHSLLISEAE